MATATAAPEPLISELELSPDIQQSAHAFGSRQVACALILATTDVATIAISVLIAFLLRVYAVPHFDARALPVVFSVREYFFFCSVWLVLIVFLLVEGLYTQRRTLWNEIGHLLKAVGLGVVAIFASLALMKVSPLVSRATII